MKVTTDLGNIKNECFVLMPFGPKFDPIYEEVLRPAIQEVGLEPARADLIYGSRRIMRDVWNNIRTARIIIAELTGRNANVLYELGLAHALGKPFVIITNSMDDVPFDLKDLRCIVYDKDHPKWGDALIRNVARTMRSVLEEVDEHGPLFTEVETDVAYPGVVAEPVITREDGEAPQIAGRWDLTHRWESATDSKTVLSLQQEGSSLNGFAISSPLPGSSEAWKVSQEVSGFVRGNQFELAATSYQILESDGNTLSWLRDNWREIIESERFIRGELFDEDGDEGTFWGEKIGEETATDSETNQVG